MTTKPRESFLTLLEEMDDLPSIPTSVAWILKTLDDEKSTAQDVSKAIGMDQSLAARLLKLVNSAYFGFPKKIDTLSHAVTVLGYRSIREFVLLTTIFKEVDSGSSRHTMDRKRFWRHAVGCGVAARSIAIKSRLNFSDQVFLAGLIHDIGKVFLDAYHHKEYSQVIKMAHENNMLLIEAEESRLGVNHTDFGYWLTEAWNLPEYLASTVVHHHTPTQDHNFYILTCLVHIGDILARALELGSGGDELIPAIDRQAWASLNLSPALLENIMVKIDDEVDQIDFYRD